MNSRSHARSYDAASMVCMYYDRMHDNAIDGFIKRRLQAFPPFLDRLELDGALKGHEGCVNCLEWNSSGSMLASGSDDLQVIFWDPFKKRRIDSILTKHLGNMFSVKFLPRHNDALIATAAADQHIFVFDVNRKTELLLSCNCHGARVKRLATAPDSPYVFWSAGEDGIILQLDIREEHHCRSPESPHRVLINLGKLDTNANAEAKCCVVHPRRTELLAVGANDPYARIYDRRMLKCTSSVSAVSGGGNGVVVNNPLTDSPTPWAYYCPGHINQNNNKSVEHESRAITYLTFNSTGGELLVNLGGEQIYLYDVFNADHLPVFLSLPDYKPPETPPAAAAAACASPESSAPSRPKLPEHIESKKKQGNECLENEKYLRAIDLYSEAIALAPHYAVLYLNRATAYMRRLWYGDIYAALRDCQQALRLDPGYTKAHFRLARALLDLGLSQEADECLKELIHRFPSYVQNHGVQMLHKLIKESMQIGEAKPHASFQLTDNEYLWRSRARDYHKRFVGHCNSTTDIKEANYFGADGQHIVAGSDDGNFFLWDRATGRIRAIYKADSAIVNCVQPHPEFCLLATSGIDHDIKLWTPIAASEDEIDRPHLVVSVDKCVADNQRKMMSDPFDVHSRDTFCFRG